MGSVRRCRNGTGAASSVVSAVGLRNLAVLSYGSPLVEDIIEVLLSSMRERSPMAIPVEMEGEGVKGLFSVAEHERHVHAQVHRAPVCARIEVP